jgi:hypothetical protein
MEPSDQTAKWGFRLGFKGMGLQRNNEHISNLQSGSSHSSENPSLF